MREPDLAADPNASLNDRIAASEKAMLEEALRRHNNNRTATARAPA